MPQQSKHTSQIRRRPGWLRDVEDAHHFFACGWASTDRAGRIRWRMSIILPILLERQAGRCHWCHGTMDPADFTRHGSNHRAGPDYPTFEHLTALRQGGRDHPSNLVLSHNRCNQARDAGRFQTSRSATLAERIQQTDQPDAFQTGAIDTLFQPSPDRRLCSALESGEAE